MPLDGVTGARIRPRLRHDHEPSQSGGTIERKVAPVQREHATEALPFGDAHERCIGEVHREVLVLVHSVQESGNVSVFERGERDGLGGHQVPQSLLGAPREGEQVHRLRHYRPGAEKWVGQGLQRGLAGLVVAVAAVDQGHERTAVNQDGGHARVSREGPGTVLRCALRGWRRHCRRCRRRARRGHKYSRRPREPRRPQPRVLMTRLPRGSTRTWSARGAWPSGGAGFRCARRDGLRWAWLKRGLSYGNVVQHSWYVNPAATCPNPRARRGRRAWRLGPRVPDALSCDPSLKTARDATRRTGSRLPGGAPVLP